MVSLKLLDIPRDPLRISLYFDKFEFSLTAIIPGLHYFRNVKTEKEFTGRLKRPLNYFRQGGVKYRNVGDTYASSLDALLAVTMWRYKVITAYGSSKLRISISRDNLYFYTSDLSLFEQFITDVIVPNNITFSMKRTEIAPHWEKGIIYHAQPKHKLRLFLTAKGYSAEQIVDLTNYVSENKKNIKLSPALDKLFRSYARRPHMYIWGNMFIDINDEMHVTVLSLKFDGLIRRVCDIKQR